jgi:NAD+ synthetase
VKIALAQINPTVGDFAGNRALIERAAHEAYAAGAHLAVFPELVVCGYPAEDLLLRDAFLAAHDRTLEALASTLPPDLCVLVGCLARNDERQRGGRALFNAVAAIEDGLVRIVARKSLLPTYDVFDELRYFEPWTKPEQNLIEVQGTRVGLVICEDSWNDDEFWRERLYQIDPVARVVGAGARVVVNLSASPWCAGRDEFRHRMFQQQSRRHDVPVICVNMVGGNVEMQFDGSSMALKPEGLAFAPVPFASMVRVVDTDAAWTQPFVPRAREEMWYRALTQGIHDYGHKFGLSQAVVGLSGGIDSALVATLAADALGPNNVVGVAMPSRYSSAHSVSDAEILAKNLGIRLEKLPIHALQGAFEQTLAPLFSGTKPGLAEENLQARVRGNLLMAFSNKFGPMVLTTGNKSESAVGYCTLYGDMCGALAPIADLWKTEVYALARWINRDGERIPQGSLVKPPSAELRENQRDTDSLPPYEELDPVLRCLVEQEMSTAAAARATGMDIERVQNLYGLVHKSEFKRYQYAPALRLTERSWGGRRMPVSHRFLRETTDA